MLSEGITRLFRRPGHHKRVYLFHEGGKEDTQLLGGKGAQLCEMTRMKLPVPPGFVITTDTCNEYFSEGGKMPDGLEEEYMQAIKHIEEQTGRKYATPEGDMPLLFSVRSGAPISMPGMMDTVLNLGMNDEMAEHIAKATKNERFAYDTYRRFIQMYADVVMGENIDKFEKVLQDYKDSKKYESDTDMQGEDWKAIVKEYKKLAAVPLDPYEQLRRAICAVFQSWFTPRAVKYRAINNIPDDLGTAVTVQQQVFGNLNDESGTGVCFTRNPATGENVFYGEYLMNAAGEDVVSGIRTPVHLDHLQQHLPDQYDELVEIRNKLERAYRDMQDIEFTIENHRLWILQTRTGKRTPAAAARIAVEMHKEGLITEREALLRIKPSSMDFFLHPMIAPGAKKDVVARGLAASPGAATGEIAFTPEAARARADQGVATILVRKETSPEDIDGMHAARGILTAFGGMTSHAAVVARGEGKCCVVGCGDITVDYESQTMRTKGGETFKAGDVITLDGSTGEVMRGEVQLVDAAEDENFQTLLRWADRYRVLGVQANADTVEAALKARELGCDGIGLCRTEHMFFHDERINDVRAAILLEDEGERKSWLEKLHRYQRDDMKQIFDCMDPLPVTIRLIDPPLHEFLPVEDSDIRRVSKSIGMPESEIKKRVGRMREANPMLGFRGCRVSIVRPDITRMQVRAIIEAAIASQQEGHTVLPEIMVPLVATVEETEYIVNMIRETASEVINDRGVNVEYKVGTMIEVPRACLVADRIAELVDFMSFGTNDLTQLTYGFSRDDMGEFIPAYQEKGVLHFDPFKQLDEQGVGELVRMTVRKAGRSRVQFGVCGEHAGDPDSVAFFEKAGVHYVSCSPYRVPIARVAAAQAHIKATQWQEPFRKLLGYH